MRQRIHFWLEWFLLKVGRVRLVSILIASTLLILVRVFGEDFYDEQWFVVGVFSLLALAWRVRKLFRWPVILMGLYLSITALYFQWRGEDFIQLSIRPTVLYLQDRQTIFLFALFLGATAVRKWVIPVIQWAVPAWAILSFLGVNLLYNESLNSALMVGCLPLCFWNWPITVALVAVNVLYFQNGSTAYGMLIAFFGMLAFKSRKPWVVALYLALSTALTGYVSSHEHMIKDDARFQFYGHIWKFFWKYVSPVHGSGLGTGMFFGPVIQKLNEFNTHQMWLSFHSDWLQFFFEMGIVGFVIGVIMIGDSVLRAEDGVRQSILLMCLCGVFYFPMQAPLMAFFSVWLIAVSQRRLP